MANPKRINTNSISRRIKLLVMCDYPQITLDSIFLTLAENSLAEFILLRKSATSAVRYSTIDVINLPLMIIAEEAPLKLTSCLSLLAYIILGSFTGVILVLRRRVDAIVGIFAFPQGLTAAIVGRITRRRFVILTDGGDVDVILQNPFVRFLLLGQLRRASAVTALNYRKSTQLSSLGITNRVHPTIGIDTVRFAPNTKKEPRTVLFVGRLAPEKCPVILIEALQILHERGIRAKLVIVGDGPLRAQIERTADSLRVRDLLTMVGYVPHSDVQRFFAKSAIFILPSRREGVALALLEAMSSGCVCIVSNIADNEEVIRPMYDGLVFRLNDPVDLADTIYKAISLPESEVARLTSNARHEVEKTYSVQIVGKALWGLLYT